MSLDNVTSITDIVDAVKALNEKTSALESEQSACKSEVSRLNRVNSRLASDNTKLEKLVKQLEAEIEKLGGRRVEKDSTNSSIPPSQQSIAAQTALRTQSLREPTGRKAMMGTSWQRPTRPALRNTTRRGYAPTAGPSFPRMRSRNAP